MPATLDQTIHFLETHSQKLQEGYLLRQNGTDPILIDGIVTVGRDPSNNILIKDPYVSSHHCQFEKRPNGFYVRDLRSRNGVRLNGIRVSEGELLPGAEIEIGTTRFIFHSQNPTPSSECPLSSKNADWSSQLSRLPELAKSGLPIFLEGESGTGKEVLARTIHQISDRRNGPLICVNCSALSESLVESELFGHIKGSFTGATVDRKGAFESARSGTLFLDEIGDLPLTLQPKLLRAIENSEVKPVGSDRVLETDVRILTATHKNLEALVEEGLFRSDLYFRIHIIKISIPPLRFRHEDFDDLLYQFCREYRVRFSVAAMAQMKTHLWPGNIRELKNTVAKAKALFGTNKVEQHDLTSLIHVVAEEKIKTLGSDSADPLPILKKLEREMIKSRLAANGYNQRRTAAELGIPKSTLHDRIKAYNIKEPCSES